MRNKRVAYVRSSNPDCEDTQRLENFFDKYGLLVEVHRQGSEGAHALWTKACGHFNNRKGIGHPLLVVLDKKNDVTWACARPTAQEIEEARQVLHGATVV